MKTITLTKADFNDKNEYVGKHDVSNFDGNLEIAENLGAVFFREVSVTGNLLAKAGSGIEAGSGIKAGGGIKAGLDIEAGWGIEVGWGIEAGEGIEASSGIKAGLSIKCKLTLSSGLRIFAGIATFEIPSGDRLKIICGKLVKGQVCYGKLVELGLPEDKKPQSLSGKVVEVKLDGQTYKAVIQ